MCHVFVVDAFGPGADELRTAHNADVLVLVGAGTHIHMCSAVYV